MSFSQVKASLPYTATSTNGGIRETCEDFLRCIGRNMIRAGVVAERCAKTAANCAFTVAVETADLLGKTVLIVGTSSAAVLAYDAWAWSNKTPPCWSAFICHSPRTLMDNALGLMEIDCRLYTVARQETRVGFEAFASIALATATPVVSLACFKIRNLLKKVQ